jgi:hypothetical protein
MDFIIIFFIVIAFRKSLRIQKVHLLCVGILHFADLAAHTCLFSNHYDRMILNC